MFLCWIVREWIFSVVIWLFVARSNCYPLFAIIADLQCIKINWIALTWMQFTVHISVYDIHVIIVFYDTRLWYWIFYRHSIGAKFPSEGIHAFVGLPCLFMYNFLVRMILITPTIMDCLQMSCLYVWNFLVLADFNNTHYHATWLITAKNEQSGMSSCKPSELDQKDSSSANATSVATIIADAVLSCTMLRRCRLCIISYQWTRHSSKNSLPSWRRADSSC